MAALNSFPLIAAAHSPLDASGRLRLQSVALQAQHLRDTGVDGVFICGSTGEGLSLSVKERRQLAEQWSQAAPECGLSMIVCVSHNSQSEAATLAAHAAELGADGVACQAPSYFRPATSDDLIDFLVPVARAASSVPFYFYDIPPMTGVTVSTSGLLTKLKEQCDNLRGVKFSNQDLAELQCCVHLDGGAFEVLFGCDEFLMAALALGATGAVGSTYNFAAPLYRKMFIALEGGDQDLARRWQLRSVELVHTLSRFGFLPASKAVMGMLGVDCGPARSPLHNLSRDEVEDLRQQLLRIDFFSLLEPTATLTAATSSGG